jgi:hypothetical protein
VSGRSCLDAEIVSWIGRLGAAGAGHVMVRFKMIASYPDVPTALEAVGLRE